MPLSLLCFEAALVRAQRFTMCKSVLERFRKLFNGLDVRAWMLVVALLPEATATFATDARKSKRLVPGQTWACCKSYETASEGAWTKSGPPKKRVVTTEYIASKNILLTLYSVTTILFTKIPLDTI